jgi:hypothetical protein
VFHVKTDDPGITTPAGVTDMLNAFKAAITSSALLTALSSALSVTQYQGVVQLTADTAVESTVTSTQVGGASGATLPASACVVLSWLSPAYWRGGKPRTYLSGIPSADLDTVFSLDNTKKADFVTKANALLTAVNAITTPAVDQTRLGFVSYATGKEWRPTPLFFEYNGCTVHDRIGTQRRRLGHWVV